MYYVSEFYFIFTLSAGNLYHQQCVNSNSKHSIFNTFTQVKSFNAHNLILESAEAVTMHLSIGENRTHQIPLL